MAATTTKQAIAVSLKRLLLKKPVNKITISDIAEDCGISRMTFYYHFHDIYDLLRWTCEEDTRAAIGENLTMDNWQEGFAALLRAMRENKAFIANVFRSADRTRIERFLVTTMQQLLLEVIDDQAEGMTLSEDGRRYIASFFLYGFIGILLEWIQSDMREEPEKMAEITARILRGDMQNAIQRLEEIE